MKFYLCLLLVSSTILFSNAQNLQTNPVRRRIQFHMIGRDSIDLALNDSYYMIEDSCSLIVRHAHLNLRTRKFFGPFKDVSKLDPSLVLSEGNYTPDGLKDGFFISRYLNGKLRSKGVYKNNNYDGKWETYYEDGKPELTFEARNDTISIIEAWDNDGKKTINNGKGNYIANLGAISWKGKLDNGRPDANWYAYKTDDATQTYLAKESFKKGKFQKGNSMNKDYDDASRMILINDNTLPFSTAEKLQVSSVPCNGVKRKHIVGAQYSNGLDSYTAQVTDIVRPVISKYNTRSIVGDLILQGEVSEKGELVNFKISDLRYDKFARELAEDLGRLPLLEPAKADGKPIKQGFRITFTFSGTTYSYKYAFLPITQ